MRSQPNVTGDEVDTTAADDETAGTSVPAVSAKRGRVRTVGAITCGALAILMLMVSTVAVWARATVFNSREVASIVGDALAEPDVEAALADHITEQVLVAVDVDAAIATVLPTQFEQLRPALAAGASAALERSVTRLVSSPEVQDTMTELVERAHSRAMRLLQGDGVLDGVSVDGEVTINLLPVISRGIARLQEQGLLERVDVPEFAAGGDPAEQIAQLEASTGRDLPDDFGQLVVYQSDDLADRQESVERAQQIVALSKRAIWLLVAVTVVAIAATVLLARDRWRAGLILGLTGFAAMVLIRSAVHRVNDDAPELAATPGGRAAIDAIVGGASTGLLRLAGVIMLVGGAVALLALIARHWRRADLVAVAAATVFAASIALLGLSIVSLLVGLLAAFVVVPVVAARVA